MIIKGQRPLVELDEKLFNEFSEADKEELYTLSKIQVKHSVHIAKKENTQFLKKLEVFVCFDDHRPNYHHDDRLFKKMMDEITCLISNYVEFDSNKTRKKFYLTSVRSIAHD